ncbi:hypothetical protein RGQ13_08720 [Thalassotalea psychrophila]|uniref:Transposase n=1 Tax=Thalassotalea psychrophila TaxID=3065647 RepID=A0ABY9TZ10_9GAMM|nr:hypothetical protein RGQ13_08720 [Colwelliaceae bacterium SQ149]
MNTDFYQFYVPYWLRPEDLDIKHLTITNAKKLKEKPQAIETEKPCKHCGNSIRYFNRSQYRCACRIALRAAELKESYANGK